MNDEFIKMAWSKILTINGMILEHCENQTYDLCNIAVNQNPDAFQFVSDTLTFEERSLASFTAVNKNPMTLKYIINFKNSKMKSLLHFKIKF